ncbi:MAG: NAD(P)H-hydrate dehydratase, partial [Treponema sp.]|nr:NAD(P)H-hydrate dehydratase [Treponema sp.]
VVKSVASSCKKLCGVSLSCASDGVCNSVRASDECFDDVRYDDESYNDVRENFLRLLVLCGSGNNGADGYALARHLSDCAEVCVIEDAKSEHCKYEAKLAKKAKVQFVTKNECAKNLNAYDVIVDCIYGTGFHGELSPAIVQLLQKVNASSCVRIACDIPSGVDSSGNVQTFCKGSAIAFAANITVAMGALKLSYYSDIAKDFCGKILRGNIGVSRDVLESKKEDAFLLTRRDMLLPVRKNQAVNKGNFGHAAILMGEMPGAAIIAGSAAFHFGVGFVTLVELENANRKAFKMPPCLMVGKDFRNNTRAVVAGPGLGRNDFSFVGYFQKWVSSHADIGLVLDADIFYYENIFSLLKWLCKQCPKMRIVLTPHPKEFQQLLKMCELGNHSVEKIITNRFALVKKFQKIFPNIVLVLKGANTIIAGKNIYICTAGTMALAKAGSGDVLSGLICALLAQEYTAENAAISAVLAHGFASKSIKPNYSCTPQKLIEAASNLS